MRIARYYMHYLGNDLDFEDLVSAGMEGLLIAVRRFRNEKGNTLSTYASHWIRQSIAREVEKTGFRIRVPVHLMEKIRKVSLAERMQNERVSDKELAHLTGFAVETIQKIKEIRAKLLPNRASIDMPSIRDEVADSSSIIEMLRIQNNAISSNSPDSELIHENLNDRIRACLSRLKPIQREVIVRRFGLFGTESDTLETIGDSMKLTRERVRQIEKRALTRLSHIAREYFIAHEAT